MAESPPPRHLLLFGLAFSAVGLGLLGLGTAQLVGAIRSDSWPRTPGVVTESRVERVRDDGPDPDSFRARISYRFEVAGVAYTADRVRIAVLNSSDPEAAQRVVDRYPVGTAVAVSYKPADPGEAVLEPGVTSSNAVLPLMGLAFLGFGSVALVAALRSIRSRRAEERAAVERSEAAGFPAAAVDLVPEPPPGLGLRLRRRGDALAISGMTVPTPASGPGPAGARAFGMAVGAFAALWTGLVGTLLALGVVFCVGTLVAVLAFDVPFRLGDRQASKLAASAFLLGFMAVWVIIGAVLLRGGRPLRATARLASGQGAAFPWTLRLAGRSLVATTEVLGTPVERRILLVDLRGLDVDDRGALVARTAGVPDEDDPVELVGPLDPAAARWLAVALSRAIRTGA